MKLTTPSVAVAVVTVTVIVAVTVTVTVTSGEWCGLEPATGGPTAVVERHAKSATVAATYDLQQEQEVQQRYNMGIILSRSQLQGSNPRTWDYCVPLEGSLHVKLQEYLFDE